MINELINKFYNGETSAAEERELLHLLEENPPAEHETDLRLLRTLNAEMPDFQAMAKKASDSAGLKRIKWVPGLRIAAAATILLAAAGTFFLQSPQYQEELTVDQARETTIMALTAYNEAINRSLDKLNNL